MKKIQRPLVQPVFRELPTDGKSVARPTYTTRLVAPRGRNSTGVPLPLDAPCWSTADVARIDRFHSRSTPHRPVTTARLLHDGTTLYGRFDVQDRFVRCVHQQYQAMVSRDSCVELFLQPTGAKAYLNFEFNCGGALLLYLIRDPRRHPERLFQSFEPVPKSVGRRVLVKSSLPGRIEPEIAEPVSWQLSFSIPLEVIRYGFPDVESFSGRWRGNFFKCADESSHPHWGAWSDIGKSLRFHQPARFGTLAFEPAGRLGDRSSGR